VSVGPTPERWALKSNVVQSPLGMPALDVEAQLATAAEAMDATRAMMGAVRRKKRTFAA
jgi:hypothetical protein